MQHETEIDRLAHGGDGIGRVDGQICFVPHTLPGDVVRLGNVQHRKGVLRGEVAEQIQGSPLRQPAACPVFGICGGCSWLDFAYPGQAEWKQRIVQDCFARIGKVSVDVDLREDPSLRLSYRTRATFHGNGKAWGFYAEGSHDVVPIESCPLCHEKLNHALQQIQSVTGPKFLDISVDPESDAILCWCDKTSDSLLDVLPQAQARRTRKPRESFQFDGVPVVNGAFVQSSLLLNRLLLKTVREVMGEPRSILDLYCGSGNFSLPWTGRAEVMGIDHNEIAVTAAMCLARGDYRVGDETDMQGLIAQRPWDLILLDPPRTGARKITNALADAQCNRIVYISCDPATLARDTRTLLDKGWKLDSVIAVDLFPHTPHIETVCSFVP